MTSFQGFSSEMFDFLLELRDNNTIQAQGENIIKYKALISKPLADLYETLLPTVLEICERMEIEPRRCISSPYTDRRFSPLVPLKEYMYLRFKVGGKTQDIAGFYFDMGGEYYSYGIRIYKQTAAGMALLRERWLENTEKYEPIAETVIQNGFSVFGDSFVKDRTPWLADSALKTFVNKKSFYVGKKCPIGAEVFSPKFAEMLAREYIALRDFFLSLL